MSLIDIPNANVIHVNRSCLEISNLSNMSMSRDYIENELELTIEFPVGKVNPDTITKSSGLVDIHSYIRRESKSEMDELKCKDCFITGYEIDNYSNIMKVTFTSSNVGLKYHSILTSKEGKEIMVEPKLAEKIKKIVNPKDITFDNLEGIVLAHMI
jgi:hypothetical protein